MKKIKKIISIIAIIFILTSMINIVDARQAEFTGTEKDPSSSSSSSSGTSSMSTSINPDDYKPDIQMPDSVQNTTGKVIGIITTIGIIISVVAIAMVGLNYVIGSAQEKAIEQEKMIGILIGAILLLAGSTIVKIIMNVAEQF